MERFDDYEKLHRSVGLGRRKIVAKADWQSNGLYLH